MHIKKEKQDEEIVTNVSVKMELLNSSMNISDFKTEETSEEFLAEDCSNFSTLKLVNDLPTLETYIKVGSIIENYVLSCISFRSNI